MPSETRERRARDRHGPTGLAARWPADTARVLAGPPKRSTRTPTPAGNGTKEARGAMPEEGTEDRSLLEKELDALAGSGAVAGSFARSGAERRPRAQQLAALQAFTFTRS